MAARRWAGLALAIALVAGSCNASNGTQTRTVLVDFAHDEFAGGFVGFFPNSVTFRPGDTVDFRQAWSGEPHSVTMGTLIDAAVPKYNAAAKEYGDNADSYPDGLKQEIDDAFHALPSMFGDNNTINQVAAQPCFITTGAPPSDESKPCPKRAQPDFDGKHSYYSSGFIPYAGNHGNQFRVKLADDLKLGTYSFYCNLHGPQMSGTIVVKAKGTPIPKQSAVARRARLEVDKEAVPALKAFRTGSREPFDIVRAARAAGFIGPDEQPPGDVTGFNLAGFGSSEAPHVFISEFMPKVITTNVGGKVTWALAGDHTITFGVPHYFPLLIIEKDGRVRVDKRASDPVGGAGFPAPLPDNRPNPFVIDGGKWGGTGEHSSGLPQDTGGQNDIVAYSLVFTKAGTYDYACLIHPRMVAKVIVKPA